MHCVVRIGLCLQKRVDVFISVLVPLMSVLSDDSLVQSGQ